MLPDLNIIVKLKKGNCKQFQILRYGKVLTFRQVNKEKLFTLLTTKNITSAKENPWLQDINFPEQ